MASIRCIDQKLDAVKATFLRREGIAGRGQLSCADWTRIKDSHPDLEEKERRLYLARYDAQQQAGKEAQRAQRREEQRQRREYRRKSPLVKCPTCGSPTAHTA